MMLVLMKKIYRRLRFGEPIIVVSGLPRSGTSMAMQMLVAGGIEVVTDGVREAGKDNPKGYFEDERVKELYKNGVDRSWLRGTRGKGIKIISYLLKNLPATNNYKVISMKRDLSEVLESQRKMLGHRGETNEVDDERMLDNWKNDLWKTNYLLTHAPHIDFIEVEYKAAIAEPLEQGRRVCGFLGRPLDVKKMAGVVDRDLYRNRAVGVQD